MVVPLQPSVMDTVFSTSLVQSYGLDLDLVEHEFFRQEPTGDDGTGNYRAIKRGMLPFADLVSFHSKMSEARRSHRLATDFSIARILAADEPCSSSGTPGSSSGFSEQNRVPKLPSSCPCCLPVVASGPEINSLVPITPGQSEPITNREKIDSRQLDRCHLPSDRPDQTPDRNAVSVSQDNPNENRADLPWLHCTRYRPPRLPKRSSAGKISKRRPGKHPRIPFTAFQLQILEDKYSKGAYLARRDVVQLSLILRLPQSRVKIWFQNRRARERRESLQSKTEAANSENDVDNANS